LQKKISIVLLKNLLKKKNHKKDLGLIFDVLCKTRRFEIFKNDFDWININTPDMMEEAIKIINQ